jgi:hypothetical protein
MTDDCSDFDWLRGSRSPFRLLQTVVGFAQRKSENFPRSWKKQRAFIHLQPSIPLVFVRWCHGRNATISRLNVILQSAATTDLADRRQVPVGFSEI